jgi:hypothetical protein
MRNPKLAVVLLASMGLVATIDMLLTLGLALEHKSYVIPLLSVPAVIPGLVVAVLAWQGRLPSRCHATR